MKLFKLTPARFITLGFASLILIGTLLLLLPIAHNEGVHVSFIDALFTSTSAVCVTGLIALDTKDTFTVFGRTVIAFLIQTGGLGITSIGVGFILFSGKKISMRERVLVKEALNYPTLKGVLKLVRSVLLLTLSIEFIGFILSLVVFSQDYPFLEAIGISAFHTIAAFNNSGFDVLGGLTNLIPYQDNVLLNLTTAGLIILGGIGFVVIHDVLEKRSFRKLMFHSKVVITMTLSLLFIGTVLLKMTEDITWLGAFFNSVSARTAGFSTFPLIEFSNAGLFVLVILMFIGASPGSTGGGIKTTTFFVLLHGLYHAATNKEASAFKRKISKDNIHKSFVIFTLASLVVIIGMFILTLLEPNTDFLHLLLEVVSAFGTVGLSVGITPGLQDLSKFILVLIMFIGRLGPLTIVSLWIYKSNNSISYSEENLSIG